MGVKQIMVPLAIFSVFLHVVVEGYPADGDALKSTTWATGWGVLIDRPTTAPSGIGWGSLIDRSGQQGDRSPNIIILGSSSPKMRPAEAACKNWIDLDPSRTAPHILGGKKVAPGNFPHMGALIGDREQGKGEVVLCGSSLIAKKFILTAAHCVNDPLTLPKYVRFGVTNWRNVQDAVDAKIVVSKIHIPPEYRTYLTSYDIAVIELDTEVDFSLFVKPACLHTNTEDLDSNIQLNVLGWGIKKVATREVSDDLLMTNITTVPLNDCNATFASIGNGISTFTLYKGQYCASDPQLINDACTADSGGPLEFFENPISRIAGIVSFGNSCGSKVPSVYSRVAFYLDWIEKIVWPNGVVFNNTLYKNVI